MCTYTCIWIQSSIQHMYINSIRVFGQIAINTEVGRAEYNCMLYLHVYNNKCKKLRTKIHMYHHAIKKPLSSAEPQEVNMYMHFTGTEPRYLQHLNFLLFFVHVEQCAQETINNCRQLLVLISYHFPCKQRIGLQIKYILNSVRKTI